MAWAAREARRRNATVLAAHVLTYDAELARDLPPNGLTNWRATLRSHLEGKWVEPLIRAGVAFEVVFVETDTVDGGLLRLAAERSVQLIVLGAHGRGDLKDRLLGGVTYKVSHRADRPVVIIPADWDAP